MLADKQIKLEVTEPAKNEIVNQGYDANFGARPLKRFIQNTVETLVAKYILANDILPNTTLTLDVKDNELAIC